MNLPLSIVVYTLGRMLANNIIQPLGTCYLLNKNGLLATAAHITDYDNRKLALAIPKTIGDMNNYQDTSNTKVYPISTSIIAIDPIRDICILKADVKFDPKIRIGGTDNISIGEKVAIAGFPHCLNGRQVLTFQSATIGAKILIEASGIKSKHIVLNIQTRPGESGSPIFKESDNTLIGMIIGSYAPDSPSNIFLGSINPETLHQTTHAVSAEYIERMI